ncbi:hypothetical protein STTU_3662 [Streptomyces sp. Tu6071]|nr:hypothetical protein STTU_3662 [Streptomyces sp. Tu6071]
MAVRDGCARDGRPSSPAQPRRPPVPPRTVNPWPRLSVNN